MLQKNDKLLAAYLGFNTVPQLYYFVHFQAPNTLRRLIRIYYRDAQSLWTTDLSWIKLALDTSRPDQFLVSSMQSQQNLVEDELNATMEDIDPALSLLAASYKLIRAYPSRFCQRSSPQIYEYTWGIHQEDWMRAYAVVTFTCAKHVLFASQYERNPNVALSDALEPYFSKEIQNSEFFGYVTDELLAQRKTMPGVHNMKAEMEPVEEMNVLELVDDTAEMRNLSQLATKDEIAHVLDTAEFFQSMSAAERDRIIQDTDSALSEIITKAVCTTLGAIVPGIDLNKGLNALRRSNNMQQSPVTESESKALQTLLKSQIRCERAQLGENLPPNQDLTIICSLRDIDMNTLSVSPYNPLLKAKAPQILVILASYETGAKFMLNPETRQPQSRQQIQGLSAQKQYDTTNVALDGSSQKPSNREYDDNGHGDDEARFYHRPSCRTETAQKSHEKMVIQNDMWNVRLIKRENFHGVNLKRVVAGGEIMTDQLTPRQRQRCEEYIRFVLGGYGPAYLLHPELYKEFWYTGGGEVSTIAPVIQKIFEMISVRRGLFTPMKLPNNDITFVGKSVAGLTIRTVELMPTDTNLGREKLDKHISQLLQYTGNMDVERGAVKAMLDSAICRRLSMISTDINNIKLTTPTKGLLNILSTVEGNAMPLTPTGGSGDIHWPATSDTTGGLQWLFYLTSDSQRYNFPTNRLDQVRYAVWDSPKYRYVLLRALEAKERDEKLLVCVNNPLTSQRKALPILSQRNHRRLWRIGQKHNVEWEILIARYTFDAFIEGSIMKEYSAVIAATANIDAAIIGEARMICAYEIVKQQLGQGYSRYPRMKAPWNEMDGDDMCYEGYFYSALAEFFFQNPSQAFLVGRYNIRQIAQAWKVGMKITTDMVKNPLPLGMGEGLTLKYL
ncbi:hypothetical protein M441DRAFT_460351 [Trichoderma asperellum CBS 433.97]|uniref:Uncharacterized protein n=1 Tax=Trichoderma asperellum (strain ATCC 204424 / CBS 433.97 / NBRC 101777) TaxID=1042311 RepID=A0A2T3Z3R5_TRIA4|nr:hypothetical protein M441DRAFT_460351 [Trichoderma asperellum CBS 433.97]PTB39400.1 hypothetical protein M441DRAFT_460351 [Trichoderma asperellum CBS 433.97]